MRPKNRQQNKGRLQCSLRIGGERPQPAGKGYRAVGIQAQNQEMRQGLGIGTGRGRGYGKGRNGKISGVQPERIG
ncbi:MAG: hypothetical protein CSA33_01850 [Desulfobulbus propionicus]|nr:MAG: hypothetical protein CSA33_01850 [Desulfobulbus propionicus]